MKIRLALLALAPAVAFAAGALLPKPHLTPTEPNDEQLRLIRAGVALHDQGDYDGAIARYKQVLDADPDDVYAMDELGFTYFTKKDYTSALAIARRGAEYQSRSLPRFHMSIGNILDDMGQHDEAIDTYRAAIKLEPDFALLHFNLARSLMRSKQMADARKEMERSVALDPTHASSHFSLGQIYTDTGYRIPAILALSRFLLIEQSTDRSQQALARLAQMLGAGVSRDESNTIHITVQEPGKANKDEGDFEAVDMGLGIAVAAGQMESKKDATKFHLFVDIYAIIGESLSRMKPSGFAARYYAPFFAELHDRHFVEAFVCMAFSAANVEGASAWERQNESKLKEFHDWLEGYRWPAAK